MLEILCVIAAAATALDAAKLFKKRRASLFGRSRQKKIRPSWTFQHRESLDALAGAWVHKSSFEIDAGSQSDQLEFELKQLFQSYNVSIVQIEERRIQIKGLDATVPFEVLAAVTQYIEGKTVLFDPLDQPISNLWSRCLAGSV